MKKEDIQKKRLRDLVEELEAIRGRHTELVSVYVPAGYNFNKVVEQIRNEQSTAQNIKSKTVRKNVMGALERILQHMKLYAQTTPENGVVIFSGNVSDREGVSDIEIWAVEPPEKLNQRMYRCDQTFILDPLKDMIREREVYGIVVIDKSDADIGVLQGKRISLLKHFDSLVPGKTDKGGWSQARYARIRENLLNDFLKKIGEVASEKFKEFRDLKGVLIGGPGPVKDQFKDGKYLDYEIKNKIVGVVATSYTGKIGLEEAVDRAEDILSEASAIGEKKIVNRFLNELGKDTGLAVYGLKEVAAALQAGNLETLLISEHFDWKDTRFKCPSCGKEEEMVLNAHVLSEERKCRECGERLEVIAEKDVTDKIVKKAEEMGTDVEFISIETKEGSQLKEIGGIAGILRFKSG
ncbi:MAG: peptide chain release factor aRF-1 [Candidatus Aenigmarchaeota archaeon]|nr:peptide chain release factor aRF-1 [Candidatus Aenigmarchaeota archaeon]